MWYIIRKGRHYSNFFLKKLIFWEKPVVKKAVKFGLGIWYPKTDVEFTGWNKLPGISGFGIHNKSARVVWQPDFNNYGKIRIATYVYGKNGEEKWFAEEMFTISISSTFTYTIVKNKNSWEYFFDVDDSYSMYRQYAANTPKYNFKTHCYFGGKSKAPKRIDIRVDDL